MQGGPLGNTRPPSAACACGLKPALHALDLGAEGAQALVDAILALPGVSCVHLGIARSEVSGVRTRETELRSAMAEKGFDAVILVEGSQRAGLEAAVPEIERLAIATGTLTAPVMNLYETAFSLTSEDMQDANRQGRA